MFKDEEYTKGNNSGLIADAFVGEIQLNQEIQFCLIACDGLWDVLSYQEAIDFVAKKLIETKNSPQQVSESIVRYALERGSQDNITALIIFFNYQEAKN